LAKNNATSKREVANSLGTPHKIGYAIIDDVVKLRERLPGIIED
jgi:hypothetical protein